MPADHIFAKEVTFTQIPARFSLVTTYSNFQISIATYPCITKLKSCILCVCVHNSIHSKRNTYHYPISILHRTSVAFYTAIWWSCKGEKKYIFT